VTTVPASSDSRGAPGAPPPFVLDAFGPRANGLARHPALAWREYLRRLTDPRLTAPVVAVAAVVCDRVGLDGLSVGRIAEDTRYSVRAVKDALTVLVALGLVARDRPSSGSRYSYALAWPGAPLPVRTIPAPGAGDGAVAPLPGAGGAPVPVQEVHRVGRLPVQEVHPTEQYRCEQPEHYPPTPPNGHQPALLPAVAPAAPSPPPPSFDDFWTAYPRRVGKPKARSAWARATRRAPAAAILAGARRYHDDPNREDEFTAHPTTWLNRDGWADPDLPGRSTNPALQQLAALAHSNGRDARGLPAAGAR
jgi:hypothetical protein